MVVCACHFELLLLDKPDSLKGKRHVIKRLKERIHSRFGVSVAEVGSQDVYHRGELGIAMVSDSRDVLEPVATRIRSLIEGDGTVEILNALVDYQTYS